jgi:hypothetical protein
VNVEVVKKLGLTTREHPHPYHIQWFNNSGKFKVTKTSRVHFSVGSYHDFAYFDVVSMDACSRLLGRPWEFDTDAIHHGRSNKYTFMHKGKKIVLLPMTPTEIVHFEHEKKTNAKQKGVLNSENQQPIKLKTPTLLATKSDLDELHASVGLCYALVCKNAFYSIDDTSIALPPAIANCRRFDPGGSLDRRVNCHRVSQPRWVGARRNTKGGETAKGKPAAFVLSSAQVGCACSRGLQASARERERDCPPARSPARPTFSYESPGPSFYRRKERAQVYNGGCSSVLTCLAERSQSPKYMPSWQS